MMTRSDTNMAAPGRGTRGETITEVLVSVLIAGLALLMLATVIASVVNIVTNSDQNIGNYYQAASDFADPPEKSNDNVQVGTGTVSLVNSDSTGIAWTGAGASSETVQYVYNDATGALAYEQGGGE